jgi:hypothetical protein
VVRDACLCEKLSRCRGWSVERCRRQCRAAWMTVMIVIALEDKEVIRQSTI